jgi:hypothetical protein
LGQSGQKTSQLTQPGFWGLGGVLPFLLDAIEVFGGSELGVKLVGGGVVVLGAIWVVALAVEKFNTTRFLFLMYSLNFLKKC